MSETQGGFKTVLVHSLTSQMSELLSTTTVELGGEKGKHHISTLFILKLRLSTLGSCSFWLPQFFLSCWKMCKNMSVAGWIEPLKHVLHWDTVQLSSVAQSCPTLCDPMNHSIPGLPVHHHLQDFTQTHVHRVPDAIQPSHPLSPLLLLPPIPPSIRVFSNESTLHMRWPKYWSFSFSINPSNEYSGLISFRMDWLDLLAVQGTLKSLLQHH